MEPERLQLRQLLIVFSVMLAVMLEIIDTSIVNTALPSMMASLGATLDEIDWVITGYIVSNVVVIPMTGWLASRFGRKRYFTISILVFTASSLACGLADSVDALVFWRVIQGLGGGALLATSQAIMVETFPARQQGMGQAIFGVGAMIGPSLGPTLGGWITDNYSWHWVFLINVPLGLLAATLCATSLRDPPALSARRPGAADWPGIALLVVGIGCLQTVLERGHKDDWFESPQILWLSVAAAIGSICFVVRELTAEHPVVDLRVLRRTPLAVGCGIGVLMGVGLYGSVFLLPVYTQTLLHWTAWESGKVVLPSSATTAVMMVVCGRLIWHVGPRTLLGVGMLVMIAALWNMSRWTLDAGWDQLFWPQVLRGLAMGLMFVPVSVSTLRALPPAEVAQGAGLYNLFRQLGGSFGVAVLTTLLDHRAAVHRFQLSEHVGPLDPAAALRMDALQRSFAEHGLGAGAAQRAAAAVLDGSVGAHASLHAFQDAYLWIAALFVFGLPLLFLVAREAPGKSAPAPAAH